MTATPIAQLADLMATTSLVMLDFDGPVCSVFAGFPAPEVARQLRSELRRLGVPVAEKLEHDDDPLSIYRHSNDGGPLVVTAIYEALVAAELEAINTAAPTAGALEVIEAARDSGRRVAVVSNNAADAVVKYLRAHDLLDRIDHVAARRTPDPALMKPNPHYLAEAATALSIAASACALVGDSVTDIEAAKRSGVGAVGYANKSGKAERLAAAGADAIITRMTEFADALRDSPLTN